MTDNAQKGAIPRIYFVSPRLLAVGGAEEVLTCLSVEAKRSGTYEPIVFTEERIHRPNRYLARLEQAGIRVSEPSVWLQRIRRWLNAATGCIALPFAACYALKGRPGHRRERCGEIRDTIVNRTSQRLATALSRRSLHQRLHRAARHHRPALLHSHGTQLHSEWSINWAKARDIPVLHCEENDLGPLATSRRHIYTDQRVADITRADVVVVRSKAVQKRARTVYEGVADISILPNWVDDLGLEPCRRPANSGAHVLGTLGRLSKWKGINVLLAAVRLLRDRGWDISVVVAGEGEEEHTFRSLAGEYGIADNVQFPGVVVGEALAGFFKSIDIYVQPSLSDNLPLSVAQAMSAGLPVVATRVGGVPEMVQDGETGICIEPDRAPELADALETLLRDPERATKMGYAGRDRYEVCFTKEVVWPKWEALYRRVAGIQPSPPREKPSPSTAETGVGNEDRG